MAANPTKSKVFLHPYPIVTHPLSMFSQEYVIIAISIISILACWLFRDLTQETT
jgi:hypothetical protein